METEATDQDGQTLREALLARLRWEYGDDAPWEELGSLSRLERDVRKWFKEQRQPTCRTPDPATGMPCVLPSEHPDEHLAIDGLSAYHWRA